MIKSTDRLTLTQRKVDSHNSLRVADHLVVVTGSKGIKPAQ